MYVYRLVNFKVEILRIKNMRTGMMATGTDRLLSLGDRGCFSIVLDLPSGLSVVSLTPYDKKSSK